MKWKIEFKNDIDYQDCNVIRKILELLTPLENQYRWSILDIECQGDLGENMTIPKLESDISSSSSGLILKLNEIQNIFEKLDQVIFFFLIADVSAKNFRRLSSDEKYYDEFPIVVDLLDGYILTVITSSEKLKNEINQAFADIVPIKISHF